MDLVIEKKHSNSTCTPKQESTQGAQTPAKAEYFPLVCNQNMDFHVLYI